MTLKGDAKFKGKLTHGWKIDMAGKLTLIFMRKVESLEICSLMGFFFPKRTKI